MKTWTVSAQVLVVIIPAILVSGTSVAGDIDDQTTCSEMNTAFDSDDKPEIREIIRYINNLWQDLDEQHTDNGEPGFLSVQTDHAILNDEIGVGVWCGSHPKEKLHDAAAFVYAGLRDMLMSLGVAH